VTVYVGNLDKEVREKDIEVRIVLILQDSFARFGKIVDIRMRKYFCFIVRLYIIQLGL
jgi:hypothetical protein